MSRANQSVLVAGAALLALTAAVAFGVGYLIGKHRAVREANAILDANNRLLLETIGERVKASPETRVADEPAFPMRLH